MDIQLFTLQVLCFTSINFNVLKYTYGISLTASNIDNLENTDATLSCWDDGAQLNTIKWSQSFPLAECFTTRKSNGDCETTRGVLSNISLYSYDCKNSTLYIVKLKNISREMHGKKWSCSRHPSNDESNLVTINVQVPVRSTTLLSNTNLQIATENKILDLKCRTSECRPEPRILWYQNDKVMTNGDKVMISQSGDVDSLSTTTTIQPYTSSLRIQPTRDMNGLYFFCSAGNSNDDFIQSKKILLNVTYPPDWSPSIDGKSNNSEVIALQGDIVNLECSAKGGNPLPVLQWNYNNESPMYVNGDTVTKTISWPATGQDPVGLTCRSLHPDRNDTVYVTINILYPPDPPEIKIQTSSGSYDEVHNILYVIEGRPLTLKCSAKSNPSVSLFKWNVKSTTYDSDLYLANYDRYTKSISCNVSNVMRISDSRPPITGYNITRLEVNVLYPPTLNKLEHKTIIEGDNLDYPCSFTVGNPSATNITLSFTNTIRNGQQLQINNVSRTHAGVYKCTVQNVMASSDGTRAIGNDSGEFNLTVQYKAKVLKFLINEYSNFGNVTVSENDAVNMTCLLEGNPLPRAHLLHQKASYIINQQVEVQSRQSALQTFGDLLLTSYFLAQCTDAGEQTCIGDNTFHNKLTSTSNKSISLYVKCKPRKSPFFTIRDTIRTPTSVDIELSFTALAFPIPPPENFVWSRKVETTYDWENITSGNKTNIKTKGLQSTLTIKKVSKFDYGMYRLLIVNDEGKFNQTFDLISTDFTGESSNPQSNASLVAAASGGAIGGLVLVLAVIMVVIFHKRRRENKKKKDVSSRLIDLDIKKDGYKKMNRSDQQRAFSNAHEQSPALPGRQSMDMNIHGLQELDDCDENLKIDYAVYGNTPDKIKRIERVDVDELFPYLTDKSVEFFGADYAKLPQGLTKPYEFSQKPENIALNRYHGIYPYDHARVKIPSIPDYFINASYIDGYKRKRAYIASLGPLKRTSKKFVIFWQMVWSEKSDVIVMLTKLTEPSGVKCEQYWPKDGTSVEYDDVTVTSTGEEIFSDYVMRTFSVSKGGQKRKLTHFHFMAWPDKSIPEDVTCLLEFRRSVRANHSTGPLIVHCSAGIGRTGTLIAIDILIEEGQKKGSVNVLECVKTMREQRTNMVQTLDQYFYIYKALVNALVFDNEAIPADKIHKYTETSKLNRFSDMFQKFNMSVESETTIESNSRMINKACKEKNRAGSDVPGDAHRVRIFLNRGMDASDYINATYLNSFTVADHFIVAQTPLLNGVEDFLCLIYQEKCSCVVSMDGDQTRQDVGLYLPPDNANFSIGSFNIQCSRLDTKETYNIRKLKIECTGQLKGVEKVVYHFEFLGWSDGNKVPNDPQQFVEFTKDVERFSGQFGTEGSHVLVHCLNAFERSCLFCAVVALTEKIKHEKEVCIPNTLRQIRTRRKLAIPTLEQFRFCYQAADAYVNMEKAGINNAENSYMNVTMNS